MVWDLKQKVYVNNPHTLQELENEIRRVLSEITERELQKVFQNFLYIVVTIVSTKVEIIFNICFDKRYDQRYFS